MDIYFTIKIFLIIVYLKDDSKLNWPLRTNSYAKLTAIMQKSLTKLLKRTDQSMSGYNMKLRWVISRQIAKVQLSISFSQLLFQFILVKVYQFLSVFLRKRVGG